MVIPVCFKCQSPVRITAESTHGVDVISYQCLNCGHSAANFLLGYVEPDEGELDFQVKANVETKGASVQRAKYFRESSDQYKLRARMQGFKELRTSPDEALSSKPPEASDDTE